MLLRKSCERLCAFNLGCVLAAEYFLANYCNMIKNTFQKMNFSINHFFSKYDQLRRKLQIWSHLLKKSIIENFIFCVAKTRTFWGSVNFSLMKIVDATYLARLFLNHFRKINY